MWLVFAYTHSARPADEVEWVRSHFDAVARRVEVFDREDASATLYDFSRPPTDVDGRQVMRSDTLGCLRSVPVARPS